MNRFNLLTYTAAVALAVTACASSTRPGLLGKQHQQLPLASAGTVEKTVLAGHTGPTANL